MSDEFSAEKVREWLKYSPEPAASNPQLMLNRTPRAPRPRTVQGLEAEQKGAPKHWLPQKPNTAGWQCGSCVAPKPSGIFSPGFGRDSDPENLQVMEPAAHRHVVNAYFFVNFAVVVRATQGW
jgi:hypothetical protein